MRPTKTAVRKLLRGSHFSGHGSRRHFGEDSRKKAMVFRTSARERQIMDLECERTGVHRNELLRRCIDAYFCRNYGDVCFGRPKDNGAQP